MVQDKTMEGNTRQNCYYIVCGEALYRTTWLCRRRYYIVPDMLSYRNGGAIMSYHMMLDHARKCCIVAGVLFIVADMLLYRTR